MDCRRYRDALSEAAAGALASERRRKLDEHLAQCAECAARLERLQRARALVDEALSESATVEPSHDWLRGIERRLAAEAELSRHRLSYGILVAGVAAVVVVAGLWALRGQLLMPSPSAPASAPVAAAVHPKTSPAAAKPQVTIGPEQAAARRAHSGARSLRQGRLSPPAAARPKPRNFVLVEVRPEREAVTRLYDLLQSGKINGQSLLKQAPGVNKPIVIAPLRIKPLTIPPIDMESDSSFGQGQSFDSGRSDEPGAGANKERTP